MRYFMCILSGLIVSRFHSDTSSSVRAHRAYPTCMVGLKPRPVYARLQGEIILIRGNLPGWQPLQRFDNRIERLIKIFAQHGLKKILAYPYGFGFFRRKLFAVASAQDDRHIRTVFENNF